MEREPLSESVIISGDLGIENEISQSMAENRIRAICGFPIKTDKYAFNSFPFSYKEAQEEMTFNITPNELDAINRNRQEIYQFTQKLQHIYVQNNIEISKETKNVLDSFPTKYLTIKCKYTFPMQISERKQTKISKPSKTVSSLESGNLNDFKFPLFYVKERSKFPFNDTFIKFNSTKLNNNEAKYCLSKLLLSPLLTKLNTIIAEENDDTLTYFPINKLALNGQYSEKKCDDELVFPIKTEIFSIRHITNKICYNNSEEKNTSSSSTSTMTQFRNLVPKNKREGELVETNNKTQTNLKSCEHEHLEQEQDHPTHSSLHNCNDDDMFAIEEAKNIINSEQSKNCDEIRHFAEHFQNSRSAPETYSSHKNMNDLQKHHQQQQGKEIQLTTITALASNSMTKNVQRDDKIADFNSKADIRSPNNLSNNYFGNQPSQWSTCLIHSEVRDLSSQEDLVVVNGRVTYEKNIACIGKELYYPPAYESLYVNELQSFTSSTPTRSTTHTTTEAPHVHKQNECLVGEKFRSNIKPNDFGDDHVVNVSTEIDGEGGEKFTTSQASVLVRAADIAMTLENVAEEIDEDNISVSSSQFDNNQYSIDDEESLYDMKFEMNNSKYASGRAIGNNTKIQVKSEPKQLVPENGKSVLVAATDLSKLANFGKTRLDSNLKSNSTSNASLDESVLPTRTLLRRQRRLQSQGSEDKQEDPIERLNRLRARISGALSEVKGVLKHYSVDETTNTNPTPVIKSSADVVDTESQNITENKSNSSDDGPINFRFIKKVRRRSTFDEEDVNKLGKDLIVETSEVKSETTKSLNTNIGSKPVVEEKTREPTGDLIRSEICVGCSLSNDLVTKEETSSLNLKDNTKSNSQPNIGTTSVRLDTLNEEKGINESAETKFSQTKQTTEKPSTKENKEQIKLPTTRNKDSTRRASIALVEGSKIDSPVNTLIPLKVKTQRRPSDSEAIIKRKVKVSEPGSSEVSTKKVKTIIKVKRPSVKSKADALAINKSASKADINLSNNNVKDVVSSALEVSNAITSAADAVTANVEIKTAVPTTSETLSTQLAITNAINDALLNSAEKLNDASAEDTQSLSIATNNSRTPIKLVDESGAMVAALVSPLWTSESNSQTSKAETNVLSVLVNNNKVDTYILEKEKDQQRVKEEHLDINAQAQINESKHPVPAKEEEKTSKSNFTDPVPTKPLDNINYKNNDTNPSETLPILPVYNTIETIKTDPHSIEIQKYSNQHSTSQETPHHFISSSTQVCQNINKMPELQVAPTPVKPVQVFAENDTNKTTLPAKKTIVKRIVRKNSVEKAIEKKKSITNNCIKDLEKIEKTEEPEEPEKPEVVISNILPICDEVTEKSESIEQESTLYDESTSGESTTTEAPIVSTKPKKPRKVKKKVIIKCQHRKLSVGESTFFKESEPPDSPQDDTETLERAIAYVTDDEDESTDTTIESIKPMKSCIKQREFEVGDWVMYGERFRKTQIRWKKGQITERITSISYKIDIDGKEVSAHISYIKKYTDRKVNFGGKEYLEIDYEQIAEEERKARSYSIWNMV